MNQQSTQGVFVPAHIASMLNLSALDKLLLSRIIADCDRQGECTISNDGFSDLFGESYWVVKRRLSKLRRIGLIYNTSSDGRTRGLTYIKDARIYQS